MSTHHEARLAMNALSRKEIKFVVFSEAGSSSYSYVCQRTYHRRFLGGGPTFSRYDLLYETIPHTLKPVWQVS